MDNRELIPKNYKSEAETVMETFDKIAGKIVERDIEINKTNVAAGVKVDMKIIEIVKIIAVLGIISGAVALGFGKTETGFMILSNTIIGVFAFLGGRSLAKN